MIIENHLFLKITDGKPPFIGVAYERHAEFHAGDHYAELLEHKNPMFTLYIENDRGLLQLTLRPEGQNHLITYGRINCKWPELHRWLELCAKAKVINFGHVVQYDFGYAVAKTKKGKPFYFPVRKIVLDLDGDQAGQPIIKRIN